MTVRFYSYDIKKIDYGKQIRKLYTFTFILEFNYNSTLEYIKKYNELVKQVKNLYSAEVEEDGYFYVYLRKKKYKLESEVNII